jgi:S-adenosylmethionine hydrolase
MIALFTDFGSDDIYVAQIKAALLKQLHRPVPIIDLLQSVPAFDIAAGAHLLAALQPSFSPRTVFLAVVDPGVGTERGAVVVEADDRWFVGPDNGLLSVVAARATEARTWRVLWRPPALSASFHGRDLFAPIAAWIASGTLPDDKLEPAPGLAVQLGAADRPNVIYIDHYGNALTGLRACNVPANAALSVAGRGIDHARVFADARPGNAFWYGNSIGLVEIAANRASAAELLGVAVGDPVSVHR